MENQNFIRLKEIDSTNSYALRNLAELSDRQIIIADKQLSGRGRLERRWISDVENNVYMSIVLKPSTTVDANLPLANITQYMSVVLCRILEEYGIESEIKWPNDVLVRGKKISGILSEASIRGMELRGFVLGVGVNLNCSMDDISKIDQPATSLNLLLDGQIDRDSFIERLADEFFENYDMFLKQGFPFIKSEYVQRSGFLGKNIVIKTSVSSVAGMAKGINDDGALVLVKENGEEVVVLAGDLVVLG